MCILINILTTNLTKIFYSILTHIPLWFNKIWNTKRNIKYRWYCPDSTALVISYVKHALNKIYVCVIDRWQIVEIRGRKKSRGRDTSDSRSLPVEMQNPLADPACRRGDDGLGHTCRESWQRGLPAKSGKERFFLFVGERDARPSPLSW